MKHPGGGSKDMTSTRQAASSSKGTAGDRPVGTRRIGTRPGKARTDEPSSDPAAAGEEAGLGRTGPGIPGEDGSDSPEPAVHGQKPGELSPGLYIVATPIGNLRDLTFRARDVLAAADLILCEDTRVTARLCSAHGIATRMKPYHEHNAQRVRPQVLAMLLAGAAIALVSDAGTPLIADPGYRLVREARAAGIAVVPLPGAASPVVALSAAGLPTDRFYFGGFLGSKSVQRRQALQDVAALPASLVFLTGVSRLPSVLADMAAILGRTREGLVAREMTKRFETFDLQPLGALAAAYAASGPPRGEVVIVVGPPAEPERPAEEAVDAALRQALAQASLRDAAEQVAQAFGLKRRDVYARALALRGTPDDRERN